MDKNYVEMERVLQLRDEIYDMMLPFVKSEPGKVINPYYYQIVDNGAVGINFSYGFPATLYTPFGGISITGSFVLGEIGAEDKILKMLVEKYGAVMVQEKISDASGEYGPIYSLTKLPWAENVPVLEYKKHADYMDSSEVNKLFEQVNS